MLFFSNSKINLGLNVIEKQSDNYHKISSVFYPIPFYDIIDVVKSESYTYKNTGIIINCNPSENLCFKAFSVMKKKFSQISAIKIHHHKLIPPQMGLGAGSANAVTILNSINDLFELKVEKEDMKKLAEQIGSDCKFFVDNTVSIITGIGNEIRPIELNLHGYKVILILPKKNFISTKWAYEKIKPQIPNQSIENIITKPLTKWKQKLYNDFENIIFYHYPILNEFKNRLYESGAIYSSLTGTGACIYGIFESNQKTNIKENEDFAIKEIIL